MKSLAILFATLALAIAPTVAAVYVPAQIEAKQAALNRAADLVTEAANLRDVDAEQADAAEGSQE